MVVTEVVGGEEKAQPNNNNPQLVVESSADDENKATTEGYASDGFETASESDVINDDNNDYNQHISPNDNPIPIIVQDHLPDDQIKQKTLEDANDAKLRGNDLFGSAQYEDALFKYDLALQLVADLPSSVELRSVCHGNRAACFLKMGKYEDSVKECTKALELNPSYKKILLRRAEAHEKLQHFEEAVADLKKFLEMEPSNLGVKRSAVRLESLASEKREKMKEEMIGKLKDVGNTILGKFGMSVDNFKAVQDPKTGSYSLSYQP